MFDRAMTLVTNKEESTSLETNLGSGRGGCFDLVLDDGTYLADALAFDGHAVGLAIGGHTGYLSFSDVSQVQGHSISHWMRHRRYHDWPFIGPWLRHRWARSIGVEPRHPDWRPKI
jgi:hypothetical protein